jgi:hypothetical protein
MGVARALDGHVTVDFLTNESPLSRSRVAMPRNLLYESGVALRAPHLIVQFLIKFDI